MKWTRLTREIELEYYSLLQPWEWTLNWHWRTSCEADLDSQAAINQSEDEFICCLAKTLKIWSTDQWCVEERVAFCCNLPFLNTEHHPVFQEFQRIHVCFILSVHLSKQTRKITFRWHQSLVLKCLILSFCLMWKIPYSFKF